MSFQEPRYVTVDEVAKRFGVSRETIYRWKNAGNFPLAYKIGPGTTRWKVSEIDEWENSLQASMMFELRTPEG